MDILLSILLLLLHLLLLMFVPPFFVLFQGELLVYKSLQKVSFFHYSFCCQYVFHIYYITVFLAVKIQIIQNSINFVRHWTNFQRYYSFLFCIYNQTCINVIIGTKGKWPLKKNDRLFKIGRSGLKFDSVMILVIAQIKMFMKIMFPMLKSPTNYGFHELFLNFKYTMFLLLLSMYHNLHHVLNF